MEKIKIVAGERVHVETWLDFNKRKQYRNNGYVINVR